MSLDTMYIRRLSLDISESHSRDEINKSIRPFPPQQQAL